MFESKQSQTKLDSTQTKYLVINPAVVLDSIVISRALMEDDLVIRQFEEGIFSIFKDGKKIVEYLNKLTSDYGYAIVLYSNGSEHQIIQALGELNEVCKQNGLKGFPKVAAMLVKDCEDSPKVRTSELRVDEGCSHGIFVARYSLESQRETEILDRVSKVIHLSQLDHNSYIVLDNRSFFIKTANQEGWNAFDSRAIPLKTILCDLCLKKVASNKQRYQANLEEQTQEEEKKESLQTNNSKSEPNSTPLPETFKIQAQHSIDLQPTLTQSFFHHKKLFVGREFELTQLKKHFSCNTGIVGCVIVGGAGLGKSQLAVEYLIRNQKEMYSEVIWLQVAQDNSIVDQIRAFLERHYKIDVDSKDENSRAAIIKKFYQILSKDDSEINKSLKRACVVFDNAYEMVQLADYLPHQNSYQNLRLDIIVTARYGKWEKPLDNMIELLPFEIEDTKNYISICLSHSRVDRYDNCLSIEAAKLNGLVGGLPLALSLAITYMEQKGISISNFCDSFTKQNYKEDGSRQSQKISKKARAEEEDENELKALNVVSMIFSLILPELRLMSGKTGPVLDLLPYLSPDHMHVNISFLREYWMKTDSLTSIMQYFDQALTFMLPYLAIILTPIHSAQTQFEQSEKVSTEGINKMNLKVNPLILRAIRLAHQRSGVYETIYENVFDWVFYELDYNERNMEDVKRAELFVIHGIHLESLPNYIDELRMAKLFEKIGYHQLYGARNYDIAVKYYEKALVIKEKHYSKDHPSTVAILGNLGNAWGFLGSYDKQIDLLTRALEISEKNYGKDHQKTGIALNNLGNAWGDLGNYDKQRDLLTRALEINEKQYGKDHPETGATLTSLGNAWGSLGNYDKQRDLLTRALEIKEKHYGKDHPSTEITLTNLGNAWGDLGNYEKQRDFLTRALEINEKYYVQDHPSTGVTLASLGNAWGSLGNYDKQRDLLIRALEINEKHHGKNHPETGATLTNLGRAWGLLGDYEKQKDSLLRALEINEKHYGKDHPQTASTLTFLGNSWRSLGIYEKATDLLAQALQIYEKHYGKDHLVTGIPLMYLGNAWGELGKYEKQKELLAQALEIFEKNHGKDHLNTGYTLNYFGSVLGKLGHYEKQKELLIRALEIFEKHYGKEHPQICIVLDNLGNAWGQLGEYEKQRDLLIRALEIKQRYYEGDHLQISLTLNNLANAREGLGEYEQQKELLIQALEIKEKYYGKGHLSTGMTLANLGRAWGQLGENKTQVELLNKALKIFEKHFDKDHVQIGLTLYNIADAWREQGDYEKQKDLLVRALQIFENHYGKDHPQTITILEDLADAWQQLGDYEKQKELLAHAMELQKKQNGKDSSITKSNQTGSKSINIPLQDMEDMRDIRSTTKNLRSNSGKHSLQSLKTFKKDSILPSEIDPSRSTGSLTSKEKYNNYQALPGDGYFFTTNGQTNNISLNDANSESTQ